MHVVLLDTRYEMRRFPFGSASPAFLLPVLQRRMLRRTLEWLALHRLQHVTLVSHANPAEDFEFSQALIDFDLKLARSVPEALERSRRGVASNDALLLMQANLHPPPELALLASEHQATGRALTLVRGACQMGPGQYTFGPPAMALASPILARVAARELDPDRPLVQLVKLARDRGLTHGTWEPSRLPVEINHPYALYHANLGELHAENPELRSAGLRQVGERVWAHAHARIERVDVDPRGGIVVVGPGAVVAEGSVLRGPTIVGARSIVEPGAMVHHGLVLEDTTLPRDTLVANAVVGPTLMQRVAV